jgi:hypothetical protein
MIGELRAALPALIPLAIEWATRVSTQAAADGMPLVPGGEDLARSVGVKHPERIRVSIGNELPFPDHPALREAAVASGLLGPHTVGLTLGYTVFVRMGFGTPRLMSHEFRHVAQYEAAGSIEAFLPEYLTQIAEVGYEAAPFEVDARNHEIAG